MKNKPIAVLISDVHYNITTLEIADKAMRIAIDKANSLDVPLIVCGDLHDTKANLRGECIEAMINTFNLCETETYILVGNHDKINEKSEKHSLNFLNDLGEIEDKSNWDNYVTEGAVTVISKPRFINTIPFNGMSAELIPYDHDTKRLREHIKTLDPACLIIMHQGINSSNAGHYYQDKSALNKEDLAGFRVISGHYHTRQSFDLPDSGKFDYVGNPYSLGFGEANDPEKGYQILYNDGSLEFVPTNLRKHVVLELTLAENPTLDSDFEKEDNFGLYLGLNALKIEDLLWIKIKGSSDKLTKYIKQYLINNLKIKQSFKLDLIPTDTKPEQKQHVKDQTQAQVLEAIIDSLSNTDNERKIRLKNLIKQLGE